MEGSSRAGDQTWFRVNPPGLAFDVGRGPLRLTGVGQIFLTHGHLDHALGLPFLLSHRAMQENAVPARIFCPEPVAAGIRRFVTAALELDACASDFEVRGLASGERVELGRDFAIEAFATEHPVPSLGYHLFRRRGRLAPAYDGLEPTEIARLRREGAEVTAYHQEHVLSYCGDTGPQVFRRDPRLFEAKVLLVEVTYLDAGLRARYRQFGHMHLDDLVELEDSFRNRALLLHHLSRRHRPRDLRRAVDERLPSLAERVHVWGGDS